jgi:hypothetical protein
MQVPKQKIDEENGTVEGYTYEECITMTSDVALIEDQGEVWNIVTYPECKDRGMTDEEINAIGLCYVEIPEPVIAEEAPTPKKKKLT